MNLQHENEPDKKIKITWDADDYRSSDYEFWYDVEYSWKNYSSNMTTSDYKPYDNYKAYDTKEQKYLDISYKGYIYNCPHIVHHISGSALFNKGVITNEFAEILKPCDQYLPSIHDILTVLNISTYKSIYPKVVIDESDRHYYGHS